jgi:ABC-2 type transport system permease protein
MPVDLALARHLFGRHARPTLGWGAAFAVVLYSSSATYLSAYPRQEQRLALARSLESNLGLSALLGPTRSVDTVGGFAAWRSLGVLSVVGAIWGVLTGSRLLRGEEESGRWEIVLSGRTTRSRAAGAGLVAAAALVAELFALSAGGEVLAAGATSLSLSSSVFLAGVVVLPAAVFLAFGLLCGQLTAARSSAARTAAFLFGLAYCARVVSTTAGDSWLSRLTPLSWVDATHPMTGSKLAPLVPLGFLLTLLATATVYAAGRRDTGAGLLATSHRRGSSSWLLGGPTSSAIRLSAPMIIGWFLALGGMCGVFGLVSKSVGDAAGQSELVQQLVSRLGAPAIGALTFLALAMTTLTAMLALVAAGFAAELFDQELSGLAGTILVNPVTHRRWLAGRVLVAGVCLVGFGFSIGVILFLVTARQGLGIGLATLVDAGLNVVPVSVGVLGLSVLTFGWAPRLTAAVGYGIVAWSFLDELVGAAVGAPGWLLNLSLMHHTALAPAARPDWIANSVLLALGAAAAAIGGWRFGRRDLCSR